MLRKRRRLAGEVFLVATRVSSLRYDVRSFCAAPPQPGEVVAKPRMKTDTPVGVNSVLPRFCSEPTEEDIKLLSVEKIAPSIILGVSRLRCRHNIPQALLFPSLYKTQMIRRGGAITEQFTTNTGGPWLRCPLLVKEIDRWERDRRLATFAERINQDPVLKAKVEKLHKVITPKIRMALLNPEWRKRVETDPALEHIRKLFSLGLIGITAADHVKCLHGHLADYLLRSRSSCGPSGQPKAGHRPSQTGNATQPLSSVGKSSMGEGGKEGEDEDEDLYFENPIGKMVYEELIQKHFPVHGTRSCVRWCTASNATQAPHSS